jgi:hypothetical protein
VLSDFPIRAAAASRFTPLTLGGVPGRIDARFFPFKDGAVANGQRLLAADVNRIITQAAQQAFRTRAAIRVPAGSPAEVNITVVDLTGTVLGIFSTLDAPIFGLMSARKRRGLRHFSAAPLPEHCFAPPKVVVSPGSLTPPRQTASGLMVQSLSATARRVS